MLNILGYSALLFLKKNAFKPILIYLLGAIIAEIGTYLINNNIITVFGEITNAPFIFLFLTIQFLCFSYFYKLNIKNRWFQKYFYMLFCVVSVIAYSIYIIDFNSIMTHNPWLSFITIPFILFLTTIYFYELLKNEKGYRYINIGVFMVSSCTLIFLSSATFYENISYELLSIKQSLHITPLIFLQLLFLYEAFLFFKSRKKKVPKIN
ncbi:MAG: hypothetical protein ABJD23_03610 [Nonlabens sp.]